MKMYIFELEQVQVINPSFVVRESDIARLANKIRKEGGRNFEVNVKTGKLYYSALCAQLASRRVLEVA